MNTFKKKEKIKLTKTVLRFAMFAVFMVACMVNGFVAHAEKKPLIRIAYYDDGEYEAGESIRTHRLYVGMQWSPQVAYEYGIEDGEDNVWLQESVGTLAGVTFTSSNEKVATVDEKGIIKAKKEGTANITVTSSELNVTIPVKVLPIKKVNTKKLVKEVKRDSKEFEWPIYGTYSKKDRDVKKGFVKANKKYIFHLYSIRKYKQPDGKYRYVFAYQVVNKKGKPIKGTTQKLEVPVEQIMVWWGLCSNFDSVGTVKWAVKDNHCSLGWQTMPYPQTKAYLKVARTYARENIYASEDDFYTATKKYGWRNMCGN